MRFSSANALLSMTVGSSVTASNVKVEVAAQTSVRTFSSFRYAIVRNELAKALPRLNRQR
jgi:hypothetical protein